MDRHMTARFPVLMSLAAFLSIECVAGPAGAAASRDECAEGVVDLAVHLKSAIQKF